MIRMLYSSFRALKRWDWKAILVCQIISFTFWVFHSLNTEHTTNIDFPIEFQYNEEQVAVIEAPPKFIRVNVSGYGWNLLSKSFGFKLKPIQIPVDFPLSKTHLTSTALLPSVTNGVKGLKVNHLLADSIFFKFDTIVIRKVPVLVDATKLVLDENVRVTSSIRVTPDSVDIIGPASMIQTSIYQKGIPINYEVKVQTDEFNSLVNLQTIGAPLHLTESNVLVRFHTSTYEIERTRLRIQFKNFPKWKSFSLSPEFAYVEYLLREGDAPIDPENAFIMVDMAQMNWTDSSLISTFDMPIKYLEPKLFPKKFKVYLKK